MTENLKTARNEGLDGPPPFLFYTLFILFVFVIIGVLAAIAYFGSRELIELVPYGLLAVGVFVVASILAPVLFRRHVPRWLFPVMIVFWIVVLVAGSIGGVLFYQNILPPRYQVRLLTPMPFMSSFLPATPVGGIVPTVAPREGDMSAEDLLGSLFAASTEEAPTPTTEATEAAVDPGAAVAMAAGDSTDTPAPTNTIAPTATPLPPTAAPTLPPTVQGVQSTPVIPTQTPVPLPAHPASARMFGFTPVRQGWNNCGPANITQVLSVYGWQEDQNYAADYIRPSDEDKNVTPAELAAFVNEQTGVRAITRVGGSMDILKLLLANNIPVIVETAAFFEGYDWIGHYQTIVAYDDSLGGFFAYDTYLGTGENQAGILEPYNEFDENWSAFNRVFIAVYEQEREPLVQQLLGVLATETGGYETALAIAEAEARANPRSMYAWFNLGSSFTALGRYDEGARAYDRARSLGLPFRMMWYQFGMFEAYYEVGRYDDVLSLVNTNLTNGAQYVEETYYWQGRVFAAQGNTSDAREAYQRALLHNPRYADAQTALNLLG